MEIRAVSISFKHQWLGSQCKVIEMGQKSECTRAMCSYSIFVGGMLLSVSMRRNGYGNESYITTSCRLHTVS